ncbi:MAG: haloacid dehalogenase-like hydrolase [Synergistales bacterium]|nr:haloacid dehalogenase-like hydrolase [Synergistales bacterium]
MFPKSSLRAISKAFLSGLIDANTSREHLKEEMLIACWKGYPYENYRKLAEEYSLSQIEKNLIPLAMKVFQHHIEHGDRVAIVSASLREWIEPWAKCVGDILVIATEIERVDGFLTGRLASKNCRGIEKVHRINAALRLTDYERIYAYGNSNGDREMLKIADECVYRWNGSR